MQNANKLYILVYSCYYPLDFRNTFTSDTTPTMGTNTPTLSLSSHRTTFATEDWFTENNDYLNATKSTDYLSINNTEVESSTYANIQ